MKHAVAWAMTLALTLLQAHNTQGQNMTQNQLNETQMSQDQTEVLAAIHHMTDAFQAGEIAQVMMSYEQAATIAFEPGVQVSDQALLEQMFTNMAAVNPVFDYPDGHEVIVTGDIALHIAPWQMSGRTPDGETISQEGLSVAVLRRQINGDWRLVIDNPHGGRLLVGDH